MSQSGAHDDVPIRGRMEIYRYLIDNIYYILEDTRYNVAILLAYKSDS